MTLPRHQLISLDETPYYHCINRCVRRAWLCGTDEPSGQCYDHRRHWITERLAWLEATFAIDVAAYAVMSNHYHVVIRVAREQALAWSPEEVASRWNRLYGVPLVVKELLSGKPVPAAVQRVAEKEIEKLRERLYSVSWFMRCLNEHIARRANVEDGCSGHFWESRFKSQALLGEAAVLACMAYVDLNPIRAAIAETPEASDYTSAQQRIEQETAGAEHDPTGKPQLMPLVRATRDQNPYSLNYETAEYLELLDWTGRAIREDKRGFIAAEIPPILARLGLSSDGFLDHVSERPDEGHARMMGPQAMVRTAVSATGRSFVKGMARCAALYLRPV